MLAKNQLHTVTVTGVSSEGDGVARIDGQVVFVRGALRGEKAEIRLLKCSSKLAYAKIERIIEASPHRIEPECPYFGKCGGCAFMHMDYGEELSLKRERVDDAFKRIGGLALSVSTIIGADEPYRYRNKAIYAVGSVDGRAVTGFFRGRTHEIIPVERCLIQSEVADRAAAAVRGWMDEYRVPPYDERSGSGLVRHVFCRFAEVTGTAQIAVVATGRLPEREALIKAVRTACPEAVSIYLNINKTSGNTVLAGEFYTLWGSGTIEDELCGLRFSLSPRSFYQVNRTQAERLYEKAVSYAAPTGGETVLDLYCGTGTITLCLAARAGRAIGAELVPEAVEDARRNAKRNGVKNAEFICADAAKAAAELLKEGLTPDAVVLDPPRKGLAPEVIDSVAGMSPQRIVYVSCDPATLARDLKRFSELGYTPNQASAFDMFPRCAHVETVVLLTRNGQ